MPVDAQQMSELLAQKRGLASPSGQNAGLDLVAGESRHHVDIIWNVSDIGAHFSMLPLLRLYKTVGNQTYFVNNDFTEATVDLTEKGSFRWYRHDASSGELRARLLPRALASVPITVQDRLATLQGFAWRLSIAGRNHIHLEAASGSSDVRLTGLRLGIWDMLIASSDPATAKGLLDVIIEAVSTGAQALPNGGMATVVRDRLSENSLKESSDEPTFWKLRGHGQSTDVDLS